ncbi:MAG TPA: molybdate ABC transporter substrate-binding protein [Burkholderiales bacterium]|nr:molybdate ABC transporter substrate-binding protein [Burkholderiales bacterium]
MRVRRALAVCVLIAFGVPVMAQEPALRLYAAGSLRAVMTEIGAEFTRAGGVKVQGEFGASGLLRERIAKGEPADVFASANMEHPQWLAQSGQSGPVVLFARNRLCALVAPGVSATPETLLERMLDSKMKLGTSTPKADPSGDYAWQVFEKAERMRPGAFAALSGKALKLTGAPDSPPPPKDRSIYAKLVADRSADIFLTYCTNATLARVEEPALQVVALPPSLAVGADYGLTVLDRGGPAAARFGLFVMSLRGQEILARHGFSAPALP